MEGIGFKAEAEGADPINQADNILDLPTSGDGPQPTSTSSTNNTRLTDDDELQPAIFLSKVENTHTKSGSVGSSGSTSLMHSEAIRALDTRAEQLIRVHTGLGLWTTLRAILFIEAAHELRTDGHQFILIVVIISLSTHILYGLITLILAWRYHPVTLQDLCETYTHATYESAANDFELTSAHHYVFWFMHPIATTVAVIVEYALCWAISDDPDKDLASITTVLVISEIYLLLIHTGSAISMHQTLRNVVVHTGDNHRRTLLGSGTGYHEIQTTLVDE